MVYGFFGRFHTRPEVGHMPGTAPRFTPGKVYRTRELRRWGANPTRLAQRLVAQGVLQPLAQGLFVYPCKSRFGTVPPTDDEVMRAFLEDTPFRFTGSEQWNALGLGSTAVFPMRLVYNTKRSGEFTLGGRRFLLRRVGFPKQPTPEWFVVDLLEHHDMAGVSLATLGTALGDALAAGRFDADRLRDTAERYGSQSTRELVEQAIDRAGVTA